MWLINYINTVQKANAENKIQVLFSYKNNLELTIIISL